VSMDLQLRDYSEGYRFRVQCRGCGYSWYQVPSELLSHGMMHQNMGLDEVSQCLPCKQCKQARTVITPIIEAKSHHFSGGIA